MGKLKKFFSSTGWETSEFGGFSQILWDLPDMTIPGGFFIHPSEELSYLTYYTQRKLMGLFLHKAHKYGLSEILIKTAKSSCDIEQGMYAERMIPKYTFSKEAIKTVLSGVISREKELKSLFIHYSNALANSEITFEMSKYDFVSGDGDGVTMSKLESSKQTKLSESFDKIQERKTTWSYGGSANFAANMKELKKKATFVVFNEEDYVGDVEYTPEEIKASDRLLEMLDISFEKAESKITSLRVGKIDIPKLAEVMSGNSHIYFRKEEVEKTRPFSVCILCDESGSMNGSRYETQHSLVKIMYRAFSQVLPADKLYVYGHTGEDHPEIHVYQDKYNPCFEQSFKMQHTFELEQNYDGPVTDILYEKIRSYTDDNILFIVLSDGEPAGNNYGGTNDWNDYKRVIEKCKRDGFVTCGIGIQYFSVKDLYQYSTIIQRGEEDAIKNVSLLINNVVKAEFQ